MARRYRLIKTLMEEEAFDEIHKRWNLGLEFRNHNELPEYKEWENTAFFLGPVVSYRQEKWWITV